jgi:hypothetical protein
MLTRREFLQTGTAVAGSMFSGAGLSRSEGPSGRPGDPYQADLPPKRLAIIATIYKYLSHAQHIGDRFLIGYPYAGAWRKSAVKVVSLYVDQKPAGDLSGERAREFGFQVYPTIAEALCCGGKELAVDAVLIIGEHGDYPRNEKGQILYPRFEFLQQCAQVFEASGRSVPVYNDKHLSYSFAKAKNMVETSRRLHFPILGGSSLPVTFRLPELELPLGCEIEDALMVGEGESDPMDFHALEALQCMVERRAGGETGVKAVQLIEGDAVWKAGEEGRWSKELLTAALSRSDTPLGSDEAEGRPEDLVSSGQLPKIVANPAAYFIEYLDGLKATLLMLNGALQDFNFAARLKGKIQSTQFLLTPNPNVTYSACLVHQIEQMFETRVAPYPIERTLLVSGILESCLTSKVQNHQRLETPHLQVVYKPPANSVFCRS